MSRLRGCGPTLRNTVIGCWPNCRSRGSDRQRGESPPHGFGQLPNLGNHPADPLAVSHEAPQQATTPKVEQSGIEAKALPDFGEAADSQGIWEEKLLDALGKKHKTHKKKSEINWKPKKPY